MINSTATIALNGKPIGDPIPLNWEACVEGAYCWVVVPTFIAEAAGHIQLFIMDERNIFILQFKLLQKVEQLERVAIDIQLTIPFEGAVQAIVEKRDENHLH